MKEPSASVATPRDWNCGSSLCSRGTGGASCAVETHPDDRDWPHFGDRMVAAASAASAFEDRDDAVIVQGVKGQFETSKIGQFLDNEPGTK